MNARERGQRNTGLITAALAAAGVGGAAAIAVGIAVHDSNAAQVPAGSTGGDTGQVQQLPQAQQAPQAQSAPQAQQAPVRPQRPGRGQPQAQTSGS